MYWNRQKLDEIHMFISGPEDEVVKLRRNRYEQEASGTYDPGWLWTE